MGSLVELWSDSKAVQVTVFGELYEIVLAREVQAEKNKKVLQKNLANLVSRPRNSLTKSVNLSKEHSLCTNLKKFTETTFLKAVYCHTFNYYS